VDSHLDSANCRGAVEAMLTVVTRANKLVNVEQPWVPARQRADGDAITGERLAGLLDQLIAICLLVATELQPFVPDGAGELLRKLGDGSVLGEPAPVFVRHCVAPVSTAISGESGETDKSS